MGIKIIEEDVSLTREDYERYMGDWRKLCALTVSPVTFESYVKQRKRQELSEQKQLLNG